MEEGCRELHVVCGPPACGKTTHGRALARSLGAAFFDSDQVAERVVQAGLKAAGMSPDDRDSPAYKHHFREPVYETLYQLAEENLAWTPVVVAGPFTGESQDPAWLGWLRERFEVPVAVHFCWSDPAVRRQRMEERGAARDLPKLAAWEDYLRTCADRPPPFEHRFVDTSEG